MAEGEGTLELILYTKNGCGLCDEVKAQLSRLAGAYPHRLTEIDITSDRAIFEQYHFVIPVVQIGEVELQAPITTAQLEAALATAQ